MPGIQDKTLRTPVLRIAGSASAANYVQMPKVSSQTLSLVDRYLYMVVRLTPAHPAGHWAVHLDVSTSSGVPLRMSISNLFSAFKGTSRWLQFPLARAPTRWLLLRLDMAAMVEEYTPHRFAALRGLRLCANLSTRSVFTSNIEYTGSQLPHHFALIAPKDTPWEKHFASVQFPAATLLRRREAMRNSSFLVEQPLHGPVPENQDDDSVLQEDFLSASFHARVPIDILAGTPTVIRHHPPRAKLADSEAGPCPASSLPPVGLDQLPLCTIAAPALCTAAGPTGESPKWSPARRKVAVSAPQHPLMGSKPRRSLLPDPLLHLEHVIGYTPSSCRELLWTRDGTRIGSECLVFLRFIFAVLIGHSSFVCYLVYACNSVIINMTVQSGEQRLLLGHTSSVTALAWPGLQRVLVSAQAGALKLWDFEAGTCLQTMLADLCFIFGGLSHSLYLPLT